MHNSIKEHFNLDELFELPHGSESRHVVESGDFRRTHCEVNGIAELFVDSFLDAKGTSCCFLRVSANAAQTVTFLANRICQVKSCNAGGWLLKSADTTLPSYWIPQPPRARICDAQYRIISERAISFTKLSISDTEMSVGFVPPENMHVDLTIWRIPAESGIDAELDHSLVLERQPLYLWNSQTGYQSLSDVYLYLVHGYVYVDRFIWPRMWKICSELDAYDLYKIMCGLELATCKNIYALLKRQILFSVVARQAADGGWYHGEWTDQMESHYRFHNGAMLLLEAALNERNDELARKALERAAHFIAQCTDNTDFGLWFLHDSLEQSETLMNELCKQTNYFSWSPSRTFGKSPTNNMVLNTHLDTIITLDHYRVITGDTRYSDKVNSARSAVRKMLALHPADGLYRILYRAIRLTLLPTQLAKQLPLPARAIKRLTWKYITPNLFRIKRIFPRLVMPGGIIDRHLSLPRFNSAYHPVNIMDLTRLWRCFPDEDLEDVIQGALEAVANTNLLQYWAESKGSRFSPVVWIDALYRLCTLREGYPYRQLMAEGIIHLEDSGLGLPPSVLGADPEAVKSNQKIPCLSPTDKHLRLVNLSCNGHIEMLVINSTEIDRKLSLERNSNNMLSWVTAEGQPLHANDTTLLVKSRNWIWGRT